LNPSGFVFISLKASDVRTSDATEQNNPHMDIDPNQNPVLFIVIGLLILSVCVLMLYSLIWIFRDAKRRGMTSLMAAVIMILSLLAWPLTLLIWLKVRPEISVPPGQSS
jgi:hypothetical protein